MTKNKRSFDSSKHDLEDIGKEVVKVFSFNFIDRVTVINDGTKSYAFNKFGKSLIGARLPTNSTRMLE